MSSADRPVLAAVPECTDTEASPAAAARRLAAELYSTRGAEFFHYAQALAHDEELARDALQEAFLRYFIALCEGRRISSARAWIYRVLHNYVVDRIREPRAIAEGCFAGDEPAGHDMEDAYFRRELLNLSRRSLTTREYACIRLRTEGLRYEEIATRLELSSGAVGTLISRAVRKLRSVVGVNEELR